MTRLPQLTTPTRTETPVERALLAGVPAEKHRDLLRLLRSDDRTLREMALVLIQLDREEAAQQSPRQMPRVALRRERERLRAMSTEQREITVITRERSMESVLGIGGFFFRARDPDALGDWYKETLGIPRPPAAYADQDEPPAGGPTLWGAVGHADPMLSTTRPWMMTFRVRDLEAMVAQVRAAGIRVEVDPERYPAGRFASFVDPEGNPIQLWQVMATTDA